MARSFGDFCLKKYGIISMPDVFYHRITDKDEFVVLATDGVRTE
jgi:serine/threonine protein phosphatase PrpC